MKTHSAVLLALLTCLCSCAQSGADEANATQRQSAAAAENSQAQTSERSEPVILLTGFEPFGPHRPPNPSWEGVKGLDGETWKGYRIVARELPVVWGAPLQHLSKWIDELKPVAVFSIGQGNGYALETVAHNQRGRFPDNLGQLPTDDFIVEGSSAKFNSTFPVEPLANQLKSDGYEVQISTNAGRYLCEECLYSLEYLRNTQDNEMTVLFCHLPPLSKEYRAADAEKFVRALLAGWQETGAVAVTSQKVPAPPQTKQQQHVANVKAALKRFYTSLHENAPKSTAKLLPRDASFQSVDPEGKLVITEIKALIEENQKRPPQPLKNEDIDVRFERRLAYAVVTRSVVVGNKKETEYDHVTLANFAGTWKIVSLLRQKPEPGE